MKLLRYRLPAFVLVLTLVVSLVTPALAAETDAAPATLQDAAQAAAAAAMEYGGAISIQYALWQDGQIVLDGTAGVYSKTENRAMTSEILYGIGSISKTYVAAAMMKLVEQGKVDLDQSVTRYIPEFTMADPRYTDITVRMLLNHSSGLMGGTLINSFLFADPQEDNATSQLLERLSKQTLQAAPGAYSVYSNDSYTLAELVIERVSQMSFTEFVDTYIKPPLKLENTYTPRNTFDTSRLAKTYLGEETRALPQETAAIIGTGGMYSNAMDLAAFGGSFCGDALLSDASREAMMSKEYLRGMWAEDSEDDALAYGLGWDNVHMYPFNQNDIRALVKGGDTLVYHAGLVVLPDYNLACAVLSSGGASSYNEAAAAQILIQALEEQGVSLTTHDTLPAAHAAAMPESYKKLSGFYGSATGILEITIEDGGTLSIHNPTVPDGGAQTLYYHSDGSFRDNGNTLLLKLIQEENGQIYLYQKSYVPLPDMAPMAIANYYFERLPEYPVEQDVQSAWNARNGKLYLAANEKYTSAFYAMGAVFASIGFLPGMDGYLMNNQLQSADTAAAFLQIPGMGSRDSGTVHIVEYQGVEYIEQNGSLYMDASALTAVHPDGKSICTIQPDGYARWYTTGEAAGSLMHVSLPENGAFCVYDANFQMVASSWTYGDTSVTLPENGLIVFAGDCGARFQLTMTAPDIPAEQEPQALSAA